MYCSVSSHIFIDLDIFYCISYYILEIYRTYSSLSISPSQPEFNILNLPSATLIKNQSINSHLYGSQKRVETTTKIFEI